MRTSVLPDLILGYFCIHNSLHLCYVHVHYLLANLSVLSDSAYLLETGVMVAMSVVLQLPPRQSCSNRVSLESQ